MALMDRVKKPKRYDNHDKSRKYQKHQSKTENLHDNNDNSSNHNSNNRNSNLTIISKNIDLDNNSNKLVIRITIKDKPYKDKGNLVEIKIM